MRSSVSLVILVVSLTLLISTSLKAIYQGLPPSNCLISSTTYRTHSPSSASNEPAPVDPSKKILLLLPKDLSTGGDFGFPDSWHAKAVSNRQSYADYHGYKFHWANLAQYPTEFSAHPSWAKIAALRDVFERYSEKEVDWIWVLDSDAILLNATINLWDHLLSPQALNRTIQPKELIKIPGNKLLPVHETQVFTPQAVIPEDIYIIISKDFNGINAGSFFIRRNGFMQALIDMWIDPFFVTKAGFAYLEQDALAHIIMAHPIVTRHTGIVSQSLINAYPAGLQAPTGATPQSLVVHFAGCRFFSNRCDDIFREAWDNRTVVAPPEEESSN